MFSGQGSQYFQMGRALFDHNQIFSTWMRRMDVIAQDLCGRSIVDTLYNGQRKKTDAFDSLLLTHPAIFMVEYALARTLIENGITPDMTLGASMGTFAACVVAGGFSVEEGLCAVIRQAITIERSCAPGAMLAVLADPEIYERSDLSDYCEIASYNFHNHFVVSAIRDNVPRIEEFLRAQSILFQPLPISFPFHSRWIEEAKPPILNALESLPNRKTAMPVICCALADRMQEITGQHFWTIARRPILFQQTIESLERKDSYRYIDVGPAGTLSTFLKYLLPPNASSSSSAATLTPYGRDMENLAKLFTKSDMVC